MCFFQKNTFSLLVIINHVGHFLLLCVCFSLCNTVFFSSCFNCSKYDYNNQNPYQASLLRHNRNVPFCHKKIKNKNENAANKAEPRVRSSE